MKNFSAIILGLSVILATFLYVSMEHRFISESRKKRAEALESCIILAKREHDNLVEKMKAMSSSERKSFDGEPITNVWKVLSDIIYPTYEHCFKQYPQH